VLLDYGPVTGRPVTGPAFEIWSVTLRVGHRLSRLRAFEQRVLKKGICAYGRNRRLEKTVYCGTSCFASRIITIRV
jgi:hypothetical protein